MSAMSDKARAQVSIWEYASYMFIRKKMEQPWSSEYLPQISDKDQNQCTVRIDSDRNQCTGQ